ncbi:sigma-70 family RNA polymerase sigma factor [Nocardia sp. NPDC050793]|uniref:RNA polymerase sigma factor n=1 Tax=Nocardia sp. NPDC050793 TaxID=3155159 RepID=UPI0033E867FA
MTNDQRWNRLSDAGLVERVRNPIDRAEREAALEEIFLRYHKAISTVCAYRLDDLDRVKDVVQIAVEVATRELIGGDNPREPDNLRAWLCGIARNRCLQDHRSRGKEGPLPLKTLTADDDEEDRVRRTDEVNRMLDIVATTFTRHQRRIYQFNIRQELHGKALANALSISTKNAYKFAYDNKIRVDEGFGALLLAKHGRPHCAQLARILDRAGWDGEHDERFTRILRQRILRHLGTCRTCDSCGICDQQQTRLKMRYSPVLIPILIAPELIEKIPEIIRRVLDEDERERTDKRDGVRAAAAGAVLVGAKPDPEIKNDNGVLDWFSNLAKAVFVIVLVATVGPKLFPTVFDKLQNKTNTAAVRLEILVPGGYQVYVAPTGVTCTPVSRKNCDLQLRHGTRVTLTAHRGEYALYDGPLTWMGCPSGASSSGNSCTFVPNGSARVCLIADYPMPLDWCRGKR